MDDSTKPGTALPYKRARFSTRLPGDRIYTASHCWVAASDQPGRWRVGFTKFATRMLGEMVEHGFEIKADDEVQIGQIIGWMEGFKAVTDLYSVIQGRFTGGNPDLARDIDLVRRDPYGRGWLYEADGTHDAEGVDAGGYASILDTTIDRMLEGHAQ